MSERVLVYDGDCPVCVRSVRALVALRLVPEERLEPWQSFTGETAERLWESGIRNEMAALDRESGEIRSGANALMWVLAQSWMRPLALFAELPGIRAIVRLVYRTVSYNRRVIAPIDTGGMKCDCDPDFHLGFRLSYLVSGIAVAAGLTALFGWTVDLRHPFEASTPAAERIVDMLVVTGFGWVVLALLALRLPREAYFEWLGHLVSTMIVGAAVLLPSVALSFVLSNDAQLGVQVLSAAASFVTMLAMQRFRMRATGRGAKWSTAWIACLVASPPLAMFALGIL